MNKYIQRVQAQKSPVQFCQLCPPELGSPANFVCSKCGRAACALHTDIQPLILSALNSGETPQTYPVVCSECFLLIEG